MDVFPVRDYGKFLGKFYLGEPFSAGVMGLWGHGNHPSASGFLINPCRFFLSKFISKLQLKNKKSSQLQIDVTERAKL
jgi:hypothetical protein